MAWLGYDRYDAEFETETVRLAAVASVMRPDAPVPTCPEWSVRDVVTHVGTGHRWAAEIVEGRLRQPPRYVMVDAPDEPEAWAAWLTDGARRLAGAIRDSGPDQPVWTWVADQTAGFWLRRMLHDEIVHRYDVELAGGRPGRVAPDLAADGVSDMLTTIATLSRPGGPGPVFAGLAGTGQTLHLNATDAELAWVAWFVERTPAGVRWRHGNAPADVAVRGPARDLLLVLNRRLDVDRADVAITGDRALLAHWLEHSRF